MRLLLLFSVSLLWLASPTARAQSADDYFNGGAQAYISNNMISNPSRTGNPRLAAGAAHEILSDPNWRVSLPGLA
jgi:hypothetical protein